MRKNIFLVHLLCCCALLIGGCGSATSPGAALFNTVAITANCATTHIDSDVALWMDSNDGDNTCDGYKILPDSLTVTISSELLPNISDKLSSSSVSIENVRIDYTPADSYTPSTLDSRSLALGQVVEAGSNIEITLNVMSVSQKKNSPLNDLLCSPGCPLCVTYDSYKYHAQLTFNAVEIMTGKRADFSTSFDIHVADFFQENEGECCNL
ncbi:MAG: hypothetical protein ACMUJM_10015 [bacterium]